MSMISQFGGGSRKRNITIIELCTSNTIESHECNTVGIVARGGARARARAIGVHGARARARVGLRLGLGLGVGLKLGL